MAKLDATPHADPLLIAGGGIGGLTAALKLAEAGFHIHVFEQADMLTESGAGLQLSPNALRILREMGILEKLRGKTGRSNSLRVMSGVDGKQLTEMPLGDIAQKRWGAPYLVAHRADLQQALLEACEASDNIMLHLGCRTLDYSAEHGVQFRYEQNGAQKEQKGCALIGADGVHSRIRALLLNDGDPLFSGYVAYRAQFNARDLPRMLSADSTYLWLAPNLHAVHYKLRGDMINLVAIVREDSLQKNQDEMAMPEILQDASRNYTGTLRTLLNIPQNWTRWPLFHRLPDTKTWPHLPVTLLGDAAHPMLPFLAQGAAQAVEDADVLTNCLINEPQYPDDAFENYRARRMKRVTKIQKAAAENGKVFHYSGLRAFARNNVLKMIGGRRMMALYDWVYGA
ncbi:MAG: FAD-dependent monooxygenase [Pseudomonadota bacterium]